MPFSPSHLGKTDVHIKALREGHVIFRLVKNETRLGKAKIGALKKEGVDCDIIRSRTGRSVGSCFGSGGSIKYTISVHESQLEKAREIIHAKNHQAYAYFKYG